MEIWKIALEMEFTQFHNKNYYFLNRRGPAFKITKK
jgi:hypothetical protein